MQLTYCRFTVWTYSHNYSSPKSNNSSLSVWWTWLMRGYDVHTTQHEGNHKIIYLLLLEYSFTLFPLPPLSFGNLVHGGPNLGLPICIVSRPLFVGAWSNEWTHPGYMILRLLCFFLFFFFSFYPCNVVQAWVSLSDFLYSSHATFANCMDSL